jgi:hypothetical protein
MKRTRCAQTAFHFTNSSSFLTLDSGSLGRVKGLLELIFSKFQIRMTGRGIDTAFFKVANYQDEKIKVVRHNFYN